MRRFIPSDPHTFELLEGNKLCRLLPVALEEEIFDDSVEIEPVTIPPEVNFIIMRFAIEECLVNREFALACSYACHFSCGLGYWHRRIAGTATRGKVKMVAEMSAVFAMLEQYYETHFDSMREFTLRSISYRIPVMNLETKKCMRRIREEGVRPADFVTRRVKPDGRITLNPEWSVTHMDDDDLAVAGFEGPQLNAVCSWRGERICDLMLHDGVRGVDGLIRAKKTLTPVMIVRLQREARPCDCCVGVSHGLRRMGQFWISNARAWACFANLVSQCFGGMTMLMLAPWTVVPPRTVAQKPFASEGLFIEPTYFN